MRSRRIPARADLLFLLVVVLGALPLAAVAGERTPFLDYRTESWFLTQSPSVMGGPAAALFNPAAWAMNDKAGMDTWEILIEDDAKDNQYGLSLGRNLGFAMSTQAYRDCDCDYRVFDYLVGLSAGGPRRSIGLSYRWSTGDTDQVPRQQAVAFGAIFRPNRWIGGGASGVRSLESDARQYLFDLGLRPFGRPWLTVFGDWTANADEAFFGDGTWGAGAEIRPWRGVHLGGRARETDGGNGHVEYSLFAGLTLGGEHYGFLPRFDQDDDLQTTTLLQRSAPPVPGLSMPSLRFWDDRARYVPIHLENRILTYQKYRWFDDRHVAWLDLLKVLNRVRDDDGVDGVVLNLAGFSGRPSLLWEMRVKLLELKDAGKEIVVHLDRPVPVVYYLATAADRISLDPWGNVSLPGLVLTRSYLKGTLEKLGIGFQEFRYFEYKSAMETFSQDSMSDADRVQRGRIVDVIYEELRDGVAGARGLGDREFDRIVDELAVLTPDEALENGLIDVVGRWDDLSKWLKEERDAKFVDVKKYVEKRDYYDPEWGRGLRIPVVFAVGSCAMDSGIRGRATSAYLRSLVDDPTVPAVVLRADSPGGDVLPSDLIADAIRQLKEAGKPVIVSQGDVAASGGYWISMDGSEVLTTPLTVTGSIGVIGGWLWDDGLAAKAGVTADGVQRGRHADLMGLIRFPFLGGLPRRAMTEEELARVKKVITGNYDDFVAAVAAGRDLEVEQVDRIAQGRVWMGGDAIERGLCDRFGTLDEAINRARELAGVPGWRRTEIVEYPPRKRFKLPDLLPGLPSLLAGGQDVDAPAAGRFEDYEALLGRMTGLGFSYADLEYLRAIGAAPGRPLFLVAPDLLPDGWSDPAFGESPPVTGIDDEIADR